MDWLSNALYMAETLNGHITVCHGYKINICKNLIIGLSQPTGVAVYPRKGYDFFSFLLSSRNMQPNSSEPEIHTRVYSPEELSESPDFLHPLWFPHKSQTMQNKTNLGHQDNNFANFASCKAIVSLFCLAQSNRVKHQAESSAQS